MQVGDRTYQSTSSGSIPQSYNSRGHRSPIAGWVVKPSVRRLSGDACPCRVMVLSAVGVSRRMMVSEAPASWCQVGGPSEPGGSWPQRYPHDGWCPVLTRDAPPPLPAD